VGDPDLSLSRSLAETIRLGDPDAIAGFRDAHIGSIRSYCAAVCAPDLVEDACEASFLEFLGRVNAGSPADAELMDVLLRSTRSAAAGRFDVVRPQPAPGQSLSFHADTAICAAMPELLAAAANDELRGDRAEVAGAQASCATCTATAARIEQAERAFALAPGPDVG
jgi:hypothetical protein